MIGLGTNVLVRYIMQDDARQSPLASKLVESLTADAPGLVTPVSVVELTWVPDPENSSRAIFRTSKFATCSEP